MINLATNVEVIKCRAVNGILLMTSLDNFGNIKKEDLSGILLVQTMVYRMLNMAYLAIRGSGAVNGVSILHGEIIRKLFQNLFPWWPLNEVPVGAVTNGVHGYHFHVF